MKAKKSTPAAPQTKVADIQAAKAAAHSASQKVETTRKVAGLAKGRYKVAKKSYKLARKAAKRAAKESKQASKHLEACLALAARKPVKRRVARKVKSKSAVRKISAPKPVGIPSAAVTVSNSPPTTPPEPTADSVE